LNHFEAITYSYRKLVEDTGVALGNVNNVIEGLGKANFIIHLDKKTMRLQNKKAA